MHLPREVLRLDLRAESLPDDLRVVTDLNGAVIADDHPGWHLSAEQVQGRLPLRREQGRDVHAVLDLRVVGQLRQHHAAARMTDEHHLAVKLVQGSADSSQIGGQVTQVVGPRSGARQVDGLDAVAGGLERWGRPPPHPGTAEAAVHEQERRHATESGTVRWPRQAADPQPAATPPYSDPMPR